MRLLLLVALIAATSQVFGQAQIVQQPVVDTFSIGTSVSVPDRGAMSLGGVGRASESRTFGGFPRRTGAYARSVSASSMSTGVFIHDFEAMDAAVLNAASGQGERPFYTKSAYDDATSYAMSRRWSRLASGGRQPSESFMRIDASMRVDASARQEAFGGLTHPARRETLSDAARSLSLGEQAEERGKKSLAVLHYQQAARNGSTEAAERLATLGQNVVQRDEP